jgi:hypothetical protein
VTFFFMIWILPTPKYSFILYNKDISLSFNSMTNAGTICQPVLLLLFLLIDTKNEDSPSENPVTHLGSNLAFMLVLAL